MRSKQNPIAGRQRRLDEFAPGIARLQVVFVNVYFVGSPGEQWVVVDTGLPNTSKMIGDAALSRYGPGSRPEAIVLTHGHFDHSGSASELARTWDVPVYAHGLEAPYLTRKSSYPPPDPTVGGAMGMMSRFLPGTASDISDRLQMLPDDGSVPGMPGWRWVPTPGHSPGHISLFRELDGVLIAGDAVATLNMDSWISMMTQRKEFAIPAPPFTIDWKLAHASVQTLAELEPSIVAAGHGAPISGESTARNLRALARDFTPPAHGRYVTEPALTDEGGVRFLPPTPPDPLPAIAAGVTAALAVAAVTTTFALRRRG